MPSSPAKIAANQANSAKSKGPVTSAGKARSSQNALKHGLDSKHNVISGESELEYIQFRDALSASLHPANPVEAVLVERIVTSAWRLRRAGRISNEMLVRQSNRQRRQSLAKRRGIQVPLEAEVASAFEAVNGKAHDRLEKHEVRLERSFLRSLHELERLRSGTVPLAVDVDIQIVHEDSKAPAEEPYRNARSVWADIIR